MLRRLFKFLNNFSTPPENIVYDDNYNPLSDFLNKKDESRTEINESQRLAAKRQIIDIVKNRKFIKIDSTDYYDTQIYDFVDSNIRIMGICFMSVFAKIDGEFQEIKFLEWGEQREIVEVWENRVMEEHRERKRKESLKQLSEFKA